MTKETPESNVPDTLRTGLSSTTSSSSSESLRTFQRKLVSVVATLITRASHSAATYASHANRPEITGIDTLMALRYECRRFLEDDIESLLRDMATTESTLDTFLGDMGYESFDGFMHSVTEETEETDETGVSITQSASDEEDEDGVNEEACDFVSLNPTPCTCTVCSAIQSYCSTWDDWEPEDEVGRFLKEKTDDVFERLFEASSASD